MNKYLRSLAVVGVALFSLTSCKSTITADEAKTVAANYDQTAVDEKYSGGTGTTTAKVSTATGIFSSTGKLSALADYYEAADGKSVDIPATVLNDATISVYAAYSNTKIEKNGNALYFSYTSQTDLSEYVGTAALALLGLSGLKLTSSVSYEYSGEGLLVKSTEESSISSSGDNSGEFKASATMTVTYTTK